MKMMKSKKIRRDTKRVFLKKGTCSRTFFYILNREFGHPLEYEEQAVDPLAGGILQQGYQCGMLWGASCALGAESFRRCGDRGLATGMTIKATQNVMKSFINRTKSADCLDITSCDFSSKFNMAKFFFTGKFWSCFKLAEKWAPEAIKSATEGLSIHQPDPPEQATSCSSEVVRKMGANDKEMVIVSGFAGGLGLSGSGCGALSAAIWMTILGRIREQKYKPTLADPVTEKILMTFYEATGYEMECHKITGMRFKTVTDHTEFMKNGGCEKLINELADRRSSRGRQKGKIV
ncbi:MAG: C-GCAxxG-C-C family protein [Bacteroidales bacterium]|nr:MAG: C-GCAxxG-C-C family protein [Bacteroidales bacterium]